jgi:hypothetical protein
MSTTDIAKNLDAVRARVAAAAARAGRRLDDVIVVAVSVQELVAKAAATGDLPDVTFHFIGHLQRNKAKDVARLGVVVETVDSIRLAHALCQRAEAEGRTLDVMVQVNVGGESQKAGVLPEEVPALVAAVRAEPALVLRGLMTIPPEVDDPEDARAYFAHLRALRDAHAPGLGLSMGMSHDLEVAVEEGATHVRVGTAIFGERPAH